MLDDDKKKYGLKEGGPGIEDKMLLLGKSKKPENLMLTEKQTKAIQDEIRKKQKDYIITSSQKMFNELMNRRKLNIEEENKLNEILESNKRLFKQEGGEIDDQMLMVMSPPQESKMESDDDMEDNYTRFIMEEALSEEEEDMLTSKLEQDEQLSMLFDKIIDVAQEFAGSGPVNGPGSGVSDSIPARLSDGEFVFTAKAVEEIGEDSLMSMMKDAEAKADERQGLAEGGMLEEEETKIAPVLSQSGIVQDDPTVQDELTKRTIGGSKSYIQS